LNEYTNGLEAIEAQRWTDVMKAKRIRDEQWRLLFKEVVAVGGGVYVACDAQSCKDTDRKCYHVLNVSDCGDGIGYSYHSKRLLEGTHVPHEDIGKRWSIVEDQLKTANDNVSGYRKPLDYLIRKTIQGTDDIKIGDTVKVVINGRDYWYRAVNPDRLIFDRLSWPEDNVKEIVL